MSKTMTVTVLAMLTASIAFGAIGETPRQFEPRKSDRAVKSGSGYTLTWIGKRVSHSGWFYEGYAMVESFLYNDGHRMGAKEITQFMKPYNRLVHENRWHRANTCDYMGLFNNGTQLGMVVYDREHEMLSIWTVNAFNYWASYREPSKPTPNRYVAPQVPRPLPGGEEKPAKNDCMIVATELLHRLSPASSWSRILTFKYTVNEYRASSGHALTVWKLSQDGKVFAADGNGTLELDTTSEQCSDVLAALSFKYTENWGANVVCVGHFAE